MADTLRENGCDPCSEFKITDLLSSVTLGVSFEGIANFLVDHIVEREIELRPGQRHGNIAKHAASSSGEAPVTQTADVSDILKRPVSFLTPHESLRRILLRPFFRLRSRLHVFAAAGHQQQAVDVLSMRFP
jgi:hypothetical protein